MGQLRARFKLIKEYLAYKNPWVRVFFDDVTDPQGIRKCYTRILEGEGGGADGVVVLPVKDSGTVVLVRQSRYPVGETLLELPPGFGKAGESPMETARRELKEETGLTAKVITKLGVLYQTRVSFQQKLTSSWPWIYRSPRRRSAIRTPRKQNQSKCRSLESRVRFRAA